MHLRLLTAPASPILTTAEAKAHLRVYHDDEDAYISDIVEAVTANIDGAEGWLGRCIVSQSWEVTLDEFPPNNHLGVKPLKLPLPPIITVDSVLYDDADGVETELTSANYRLIGEGSTGGAYLLPLADTEWPETNDEPAAVRVSFTAGYASVPQSIKWGVRLFVSHLYENREAVSDRNLVEVPMAAQRLLSPHQFWPT